MTRYNRRDILMGTSGTLFGVAYTGSAKGSTPNNTLNLIEIFLSFVPGESKRNFRKNTLDAPPMYSVNVDKGHIEPLNIEPNHLTVAKNMVNFNREVKNSPPAIGDIRINTIFIDEKPQHCSKNWVYSSDGFTLDKVFLDFSRSAENALSGNQLGNVIDSGSYVGEISADYAIYELIPQPISVEIHEEVSDQPNRIKDYQPGHSLESKTVERPVEFTPIISVTKYRNIDVYL